MTCIAAVVDEQGAITMGGDSAATAAWSLTVIAQSKVFRNRTRPELLMGVSGYPRMRQLLEFGLVAPEHPADMSVEEYLTTRLMDAMRESLKGGGHAKKDNEQEHTDSVILLGYRSRLFEIGPSFGWVESILPFHAIGCGESFALGSLYATRALHFGARERIRLALEAAETFSAGVRGPFTIEALSAPTTEDAA